VVAEKISLIVLNRFEQNFPIHDGKIRVSFDPQHQRCSSSASLAYEPIVNIVQRLKNFEGQLSHSLVLTDQTWFDCVKKAIGIAVISMAKLFHFANILKKQAIKQSYALKLIVHAFHKQMSQILVLISKQAQNLLYR